MCRVADFGVNGVDSVGSNVSIFLKIELDLTHQSSYGCFRLACLTRSTAEVNSCLNISLHRTGFHVPNYLGPLPMCGHQIFVDICI
jgi:hypothetical protein